MSKYSPSNYVDRPIICTNPCAEVPLEDGGACNLGSINLSRFVNNGFTPNATINWDQLAESTQLLVRFLDNVVTWNEDLNALEKQRIAAKETRRLGLGVMGIADMLNQLGLAYDSDEGIELIEKTMKFITNAAYQASAVLAGEKGSSPIFNYKSYMECPFIDEALSAETIKIIKDNNIEVKQAKKNKIPITTFMIASDPYLQTFVKKFSEVNNGKAFYTGLDGLSEMIFEDYDKNRRQKLR